MVDQYVAGKIRLNRRLSKGDARLGLPELWLADDLADIYYVKRWPRLDQNDDLRALWNREVRGLMRLQSYPGASELFVRQRQIGLDDKHFFVVLEGGHRQPLSTLLTQRSKYNWLTNLREVARRRQLWDGLSTIAEGLVLLHRDGTLHRALSAHSVFVGPDGNDFRLSGFEWSLRVAGIEGAAVKIAEPGAVLPRELEGAAAEYSTASDWFAFGVLVAQLMGLPLAGHRKRATFRSAVEGLDHLNLAEREFILSLIAEDQEDRLVDDAGVLRALADVRRGLNVATLGANRALVLALRVGESSQLGEQVETVSNGKAKRDAPLAQRRWVEEDLRDDFRIIARGGAQPHYVLQGRRLEYRVRSWSTGNGSTWEIGFCDSTSPPRIWEDDQTYSRGPRSLEVRTFADVRKSQHTIRTRSAAWDRLFPFARSRSALPSQLQTVYDFFRVTQQLDVALAAATICPVQITALARNSIGTEVEVTPLEEGDRTDLAQLLRVGPPAEQVRDWFALGTDPVDGDDEEEPDRNRYSLLTRRIIARDSTPDVSWTIDGAEQTSKGPRYRFRCRAAPPLTMGGRMYLARNFGGTVAQIRRRHRAIENLRSFEQLLRLVENPARVSRKTGDTLPAGRIGIKLDSSKSEVLARLWDMQPSFAIQGPPGTGKTTLIKAFADRLLASDPSAQVLVTAHSHHTVDDVLSKLNEMFADLDPGVRPILVRLGADKQGRHDPAAVTSVLLNQLAKSELAAGSEPHLKERLRNTLSEASKPASNDRELRTMQLLVQDAANVTFSTSNSPELARIADRGRRFDWSIIEEAGKAHGFDMALALQESHRLIMIGDHAQLPPYNVKTYSRLLDDPLRVREAIRKGGPFAPNLIDVSIVDDEEEREDLAERCSTWRSMVEFFRVVFDRSEEAGGGPAAMLTDQHRMHPHIADLIGRTFYQTPDGVSRLVSPPETHAQFAAAPPFLIRSGSWMPDQRIVWCDLDWVQKTEFALGETTGLFQAQAEVDALIKVLGEIEPKTGAPCELQILSPYNGQLDAIRARLREERNTGRLGHMFSDPFNLHQRKRMGATVDEFQGSEADVVIVSLVRNNGLPARKSLGFLTESNRLNVLLSRARHKLVIIGSWDFFASRCGPMTDRDEEHAYIGDMMRSMQQSQDAGQLARIRAPQ